MSTHIIIFAPFTRHPSAIVVMSFLQLYASPVLKTLDFIKNKY